MKIALIVIGSLAALVLIGLVLLGRFGAIASGRLGRLARVGRLSARLSASWLGANVRRLLAGKEGRRRIDAERRKADAQRVAETMGQMKGALMKLGQMMSFVSDDIPPEYRAALASLQTSAPPMDFALLRDVAERELGKPLERAFARFDPKPIASASIGQVHRAQLPSGEEVAVKIQYPGVAEAIQNDLANVAMLYRMTGLLYPGLETGPVVEELRSRLLEELDYAREAKNQSAFADLYDGHPYIRVPRVFESCCTQHVLVSEFLPGRRFEEIEQLPPAERSRYGEILYRFVFGSIIRYGVFNGDPHPGNYLFDDQGRVIFLDFGCVKFFPEGMMADWRELVRHHLRGDRAAFHKTASLLGFFKLEAGVDADVLYDYFGYFYEPFEVDRDFTFTREYNGKSFRMIFKPEGRFAPLGKTLNMPPDFVFANRLQWGVYSILAHLEATGNWHRIHREMLHGDSPSTELGRIDHAWREGWRAQRGLSGAEFLLRPEGVRRTG
jgi:predicted unusual protein kinase regulating ubiquinone biosynthesis (AarF/ABC1/UbiB family)